MKKNCKLKHANNEYETVLHMCEKSSSHFEKRRRVTSQDKVADFSDVTLFTFFNVFNCNLLKDLEDFRNFG